MALSAFGTKLERGTGQTPTYSAIAEVTSITGPGFELETIDVTNHDSPDAWEEVIGGIIRSGEINLDLNYTPGSANHDDLVQDLFDRAVVPYRLVFPNNQYWGFNGLVTGFEFDAPYDDKLSASVTIKVSGKPILGSLVDPI